MPLYHYTTIDAVHSILRNKSIWLTDLRYLNDSKELKDGVSIIIKTFDLWRPTLWTEREYSKKAIEYLKKELELILMQGTPEEIHCTCSFSRALDQLSQWRAYGNYAIEFNESELTKCFKKVLSYFS